MRTKRDADKFFKKTISLPEEVLNFAVRRAAHPRYSGNLSAYVRDRIISDRPPRRRRNGLVAA